jgi:thiosulfate reductase cytochrome b subunit
MEKVLVHRLYVRVFHWLNAVAMVMMIMSGWQIYNAAPLFEWLTFPGAITLGGWLGGAIQWHLAAMWLFVVNLAVYLVLGIAKGHFARKFFPLSPRELLHDISQALRFKLSHESHDYNAVQKLFYIGIVAIMLLTFLSGLVVWKSVQFQALSWIVGNYDTARFVHFTGMSLICAFIIVHIALVAIVPSTLLPMITGRAKPFPNEEHRHVA